EGLISLNDLIKNRTAVQAPPSLKAAQDAFQRVFNIFINQQSATSLTTHRPALLIHLAPAEVPAEASALPACCVEATCPTPSAGSCWLLLPWRKRLTAPAGPARPGGRLDTA